MARKPSNKQETVQPEIVEGNEQVTVVEELPVDHFTHIVLEGKAKKLSPKTENHLFYEIAIHQGRRNFISVYRVIKGGSLLSKLDPT
ncbi:hypothetical protein [Vibrio sp. M260118]|uniref:hypothetical protein n=1 Tax=Vibrio sp. M260118 TaxID=3020896 RepID=UPI002F427249